VAGIQNGNYLRLYGAWLKLTEKMNSLPEMIDDKWRTSWQDEHTNTWL